MKYFIIENQTRFDGEINTSTTVRKSFASGYSFYHERLSKMKMNDQFSSVSVMLADENLNVVAAETIIPLAENK